MFKVENYLSILEVGLILLETIQDLQVDDGVKVEMSMTALKETIDILKEFVTEN